MSFGLKRRRPDKFIEQLLKKNAMLKIFYVEEAGFFLQAKLPNAVTMVQYVGKSISELLERAGLKGKE